MAKRFRRPNESDNRPKIRAPTTSPTRYTVAIEPTAADERWRVFESVRTPATEPARVISRPSSTQAVPSARTSLVWKRLHGSLSRRAGIWLSTVPTGTSRVCAITYLQSGSIEDGIGMRCAEIRELIEDVGPSDCRALVDRSVGLYREHHVFHIVR